MLEKVHFDPGYSLIVNVKNLRCLCCVRDSVQLSAWTVLNAHLSLRTVTVDSESDYDGEGEHCVSEGTMEDEKSELLSLTSLSLPTQREVAS